jgi:hypothetical protein
MHTLTLMQPSTHLDYRTDRCLETIRHVKATRVLFLWMQVSRLDLQHIPDAKYAVAFNIQSTRTFEALDLAYVLLRFMDKYIRDGDYDRFSLLGVHYKLGPLGSFGLLIFDHHLRSAYHQICIKSRLYSSNYSPKYNLPLSTWPSKCDALRKPKVVKKLMGHVRYVRLNSTSHEKFLPRPLRLVFS